jgi:hypothetical protein
MIFLEEIHTPYYSPLELQTFNLLLFDKNNLKIKIEDIVYQDHGENVEWRPYMFRDVLCIPDHAECFQKERNIIVHASMNQIPVSFLIDTKENQNQSGLVWDLNAHSHSESFQPSPQLYLGDSFNPSQFVTILQHIPFHPRFYLFNLNEMNKLTQYFSLSSLFQKEKPKINLIHLRLEEHAMQSFSLQNKICKTTFQKEIEERYIKLIQRYIHPTDELTIVLSGCYQNRVVDFLSQNKYSFLCTPKIYDKREMNAIHDLLFHRFCNHVFIGVYESSFSYTLMYNMFKREKTQDIPRCIVFKMNHTHLTEHVFTKDSTWEETRRV